MLLDPGSGRECCLTDTIFQTPRNCISMLNREVSAVDSTFSGHNTRYCIEDYGLEDECVCLEVYNPHRVACTDLLGKA